MEGRAYDPDDETADKRCNRKPGVSESDSEKAAMPKPSNTHCLFWTIQFHSDIVR